MPLRAKTISRAFYILPTFSWATSFSGSSGFCCSSFVRPESFQEKRLLSPSRQARTKKRQLEKSFLSPPRQARMRKRQPMAQTTQRRGIS